MGASTQTWTGEMLAALDATRPIIASVLSPAGRVDEVGDVLSETWIAAEKSLPAFDPERGPFGAWIATIARRQALRLIRRDVAAARLQESVEHVAASGITTVFDVAHEGFADELVERLADWEQTVRILSITRAVMVHPELVDRTLTLLIAHHGCVETAAAALGVKAAAFRETHRRVVDVVHVVEKALEGYESRCRLGLAGQPVTLGELLRLLPGRWEGQAGLLQLIATVPLGQLSPTHVAQATGWSVSTARQRLAQTRDLLQVGLVVIESGGLGLDEDPAGGEHR